MVFMYWGTELNAKLNCVVLNFKRVKNMTSLLETISYFFQYTIAVVVFSSTVAV